MLPSRSKLVKTKTARVLCNEPSSSEGSSNNAWNVNFGSGNINNNNKYNGNTVRSVAALDNDYTEGWFDAFDDCCRRKKMSPQCVMYRNEWTTDLLWLAQEVRDRTYKPTTSICFVVTRPKLREVFAANFRDRIVQHWLCLRLEPLFEERFVEQGDVSFNCRKGYGTLACIRQVARDTLEVSQNYTRDAYYAQFDVKSFFMSIDCEVLLKYLLYFIEHRWKYWKGTPYEDDFDTVMWLTEVIVRHRPQDDCIRKGNLKLWEQLPKGKSLFDNPPMKGAPIGNITSQLFANFYMSIFDKWAVQKANERGARYRRFVDDFEFTCRNMDDAKYFMELSRIKLKRLLNIQMHPDKIYIQHVKKGIKIVGGVVKPGRTYLSNRTVVGYVKALIALEAAVEKEDKQEIAKAANSVNSYLGFLRQHNSYAIRRYTINRTKIWNACYVQGRYEIIKIKSKYR